MHIVRLALNCSRISVSVFADRADYLGHQVSAEGIRPLPQYLKIISEWKIPTTKTEARVFLGKVGYYRRFIKDYAKIARPWTDVTGKGDTEEEKRHLQTTEEMRHSFKDLIRLCQAPVLAYPRLESNEPFILDTDWSQEANAIGALLSQVQEGKERVILYRGKKMSASQANYAPIKGELTAVMYFTRRWRYYLRTT